MPRYALSTALVAAALAVTAAVFLLARPQYERYPGGGGEMIAFSEVRLYSQAAVEEAFAAHGVRLRVASRLAGLVTLSDRPRPLTAGALQVVVGPRTGTGSFGPVLEPYDERFGNVLVTYGGGDAPARPCRGRRRRPALGAGRGLLAGHDLLDQLAQLPL